MHLASRPICYPVFLSMNHLPALISDLALILGAAGITALLFRRLKQPVVLGYIIAGLLVGPNFSLFPTVTDVEGISIWAETGVIFLLFALGLEFSLKKLAKVGPSSGITGIIEIGCMMLTGYVAGRIMHWSIMDSLFLGGIISISSTTIIFRAFEELGIKTKQFTALVMGVLIIEDLVAVLLMVLLSTMAVSREFAGWPMLVAIGKLLFFIILWFMLGIFLLPISFKKASRWINNEMLLVVGLGLCLGMVVFAEKVGLSAALGAFVMGSILSETVYGDKIEHLIHPIKNLFGAVFFVSVGMLIDPAILWQFRWPVLMLTLIVIIGKILFVTAGAVIAGRPLKQAVQAGARMTQIGEFSFIIATLGLTLNVTANYLYPIAVGVSVLTTFSTPFLIKLAEPLHNSIVKSMPAKWTKRLDTYSAGWQLIKAESDWRIVVKAFVQLITLNAVPIIAIISLSRLYVKPFFHSTVENNMLANLFAIILSMAAIMPFVWALMAKKIHRNAYKALWLDSKYNHGPLVAIEVLRGLLAVFLVSVLIRQYFPLPATIVISIVVLAIMLIGFNNRLQHFYQRIEQRFLNNLAEKENSNQGQKILTPWDAHLSRIRISPTSQFVGKTLEELALRERFGVNIGFVQRGNRWIYAPSRMEKLYPYDEIGVIGTDIQLQKFSVMVETETDEVPIHDLICAEIDLEKIVVNEHNGLRGQSIRESGIREKTNGLVVGIERNGERILNPSSHTLLEWDDVVWLVGERKKIALLQSAAE